MKNSHLTPSRILGVAALIAVAVVSGGCPGDEPPAAGQVEADPNALLTHGVNLDPATPAHQLNATPLKLEARAERAGRQIELAADYTSWNAGAVAVAALGDGLGDGCRTVDGGAAAECDLRLVRLAQYGQVPDPEGFEWLLEVAEPAGKASGTVRLELDDSGRPVYPAEVEVAADLQMMVNGSGRPVRLASREPLTLSGTVEGWPQGLMILRHSGAAHPFYREDEVDDAGAEPYLTLTETTFAFADKPSEFFRRSPQIVDATVVDEAGEAWKSGEVAGVALQWTDTSREVLSTPISDYKIYRNDRPGELDGWRMVARVPATETSFLDPGADGSDDVEYVVTHEMGFPFDYRYEGLASAPTAVAAVR